MAFHARRAIDPPHLPHPSFDSTTFLWTGDLPGGSRVVLREALPGDAEALAALWRRQSPPQRRRRFHGSVGEVSTALIEHLRPRPRRGHRTLVLVLGVKTAAGEACRSPAPPTVIAEARYAACGTAGSAEIAILVDEVYAGQGIGARLLQALVDAARHDRLSQLCGQVQVNNRAMLQLATRCRWTVEHDTSERDLMHIAIDTGLDGEVLGLVGSDVHRARPGSARHAAARAVQARHVALCHWLAARWRLTV
jgi:RimJ/RimL family protein N-acetyltransferase